MPSLDIELRLHLQMFDSGDLRCLAWQHHVRGLRALGCTPGIAVALNFEGRCPPIQPFLNFGDGVGDHSRALG